MASVLRRDSFREDLLKTYPGIDSKDPRATCEFLHDFILDLKPLDAPEPNTVPESGQAPSQTNSGVDGKDSKEGVTMPKLHHKDSSFPGGFRGDEKVD
ncbi:hypothetical protein FRC00_011230 [Tulasnella sp. 408]|nr:hypothetical protein FRC00_011230 [Tulasnella sp. 408]